MRLFLTTNPCSASKDIIFLKEKEFDPTLSEYLDIDDIELLKENVANEYMTDIKLSNNIYSKITEITKVSKRKFVL